MARKLNLNPTTKKTPKTVVKAKAPTKAPAKTAAKADTAPKTRTGMRTLPMHDAATFEAVTPSGPVRTGRNLQPVTLDRVPGSFTTRDANFLHQLVREFGKKPFARMNFDAGLMSRLAGHGALRHVSGSLDTRDATFAVTDKGSRM